MPEPQWPGISPAKHLLFFGISAIGLFALSVAIDRFLGLVGYPGEVPVSPPPYFEKQVANDEFRYLLRTNDRGLRYRSIPAAKPAGTRRIVVLGDSATEGTGVADGQRWTDLVEARLREAGDGRVDVINCAEAGQGPFHYGQKLLHICLDYEPDAVLVALHVNDLAGTPESADPADMYPGRRSPRGTKLRSAIYTVYPHLYTMFRNSMAKRRERLSGDFLERVAAEAAGRGISERRFQRWRELIPDALAQAASEQRLNATILTYPLTRPEFYRESLSLEGERARRKLEAMLRILETLRDVCAQREIEFAVILLPSLYQYDPDSGKRLQARLYAEMGAPMDPAWLTEPAPLQIELAAWAERESVPFLDLWPRFRELGAIDAGGLNYVIDIHWTPLGHETVAETVLAWMNSRPVFPSVVAATEMR